MLVHLQIAEKRRAAQDARNADAKLCAAARAMETEQKEREKQRKAAEKAKKAATLAEQRAAFLLEQKRRCVPLRHVIALARRYCCC